MRAYAVLIAGWWAVCLENDALAAAQFASPTVLFEPPTASQSAPLETNLVVSGTGTWLTTFAIANRLYVMRSIDAGVNWSAPVTVDTSPGVPESGPSTDSDGASTWMIAWGGTGVVDPDSYGNDGDIFVVRSLDDGLTWSDPRAVKADAQSDVANEGLSVIAYDGVGVWAIAWISNILSPGQGGDFEIAAVRSTDGGEHWSEPIAANSDAAIDHVDDATPMLASDGAGTLLLAWPKATGNTQKLDEVVIVIARSRNGEAGWTTIGSIAEPDNAEVIWRGTSLALDLSSDLHGGWFMSWTAENQNGSFDSDDEIVASYSLDDGESWTQPSVLNSGWESEFGADHDPTAVGAGAGRWLVLWAGESLDSGGGEYFQGIGGVMFDAETATTTPVAAVDVGNLFHWGISLADDLDGRLVATWSAAGDDDLSRRAFVALGQFCGDLLTRRVEQCDTAADTPDCDGDCTLPACGDGYFNVAAAEECDDGEDTAACDEDCTVVECGDEHTNIVAGEECDDGSETKDCDGDCTFSYCCDDYTNLAAGEECDECGDSVTCDGDCTAPYCGDGYPNPMVGEECDDTDGDDTNECTGLCLNAKCGDGFTYEGVEDCDDGQAPYEVGVACFTDCSAVACGQPVTYPGVGPKASDALFILRAAIETSVCDGRVCDTDANGDIAASDALRTLRVAVGQPDVLSCTALRPGVMIVKRPGAMILKSQRCSPTNAACVESVVSCIARRSPPGRFSPHNGTPPAWPLCSGECITSLRSP